MGPRSNLGDANKSATLCYTWRRPNTEVFSSIDRILYSKDIIQLADVKTDRSISASDHAAVIASFSMKLEERQNRAKIVRLDPSLMKDTETETKIEQGIEKLDYLKMCARTVTEKVTAEVRKKERYEEDLVNEELNIAVTSLERSESYEWEIEEKEELIELIEELRTKKSKLIDEKGEKLASKLKTKWHNEGEKLTRYFMRLLNRPAADIQSTS